jgi:hypothetical protein
MLYGRREERARIAALLDGVGSRRGGVLALAVLTALLWPASVATSAAIGPRAQHPAAATSSPDHQGMSDDRGPVRGPLLARGENRRGHHPAALGVLVGELDVGRLVASSWRRSKPGRGGQGESAFGARAPPVASRLT